MKGDSLFKELSDYIDFFLLEKKQINSFTQRLTKQQEAAHPKYTEHQNPYIL